MSAAEAKSTVEDRARALMGKFTDPRGHIVAASSSVLGDITEALRAERDRALEEAIEAVRNQHLRDYQLEKDLHQGYMKGVTEATRAIASLKASR
jgi:hypothetical protein